MKLVPDGVAVDNGAAVGIQIRTGDDELNGLLGSPQRTKLQYRTYLSPNIYSCNEMGPLFDITTPVMCNSSFPHPIAAVVSVFSG